MRNGTALAALTSLTSGLLLLAAFGARAEDFRFTRVNGLYSRPNPTLAPVEQGPITVQLRSPQNEVHLRSNHLELKPAGDGLQTAVLTVELEGHGDLEADLGVNGLSTTLVDVVTLPRQTVRLEGRIRLERIKTGYRVTAVQLQPSLTLAIESKVAGSMVTACRRLSILMPLGGSCQQLSTSLSQAEVPLPGAGTELILTDDLLTPEDRQQLDAYLQHAGSAGSGP